jgi:hypothetical protein
MRASATAASDRYDCRHAFRHHAAIHLDADAHYISHSHSDIITDSNDLADIDQLSHHHADRLTNSHINARPLTHAHARGRRLAAPGMATHQPGTGAARPETAGLQ